MNSDNVLPNNVVITSDVISINIPECKDGSFVITPYMIRRSKDNEDESLAFDELKIRISSFMTNPNIDQWDEIKSIFVVDKKIKNIISNENIEDIIIDNNNFYYKGYKLKNYLVERIIEIQKQAELVNANPKKNLNSLALFLNNLMKNPSSNSVAQLYSFVEKTKLPITSDGCMLAYKIITDDYKDKYTKTLDYSIGNHATMPRSLVVDDHTMPCGPGLHFCSWNYARGFYLNPNTDRMVVVKVNPMDVVSIPDDHDFEKGRCCAYTILYEIPMEEVLSKDVLGMLK